LDSERHKPRAGRKPTQGSARTTLDRNRATRDTSTGHFTNTTETRLACGICTVLSSLYAVRNWKIDFVQQTHIRQARNWMAAIGHAVHEVVSLHRCRCGQSYEQWGNRPTPPCPTREKICLKNTGPEKRKRENDERAERTPAASHIIPPLAPTPRH